MNSVLEIKNSFFDSRDKLFSEYNGKTDPLNFSKQYSLLIEETIRSIVHNKKLQFALASAGSFSRRELSPYSDIDLMFITDSVEKSKEEISDVLKLLWDSGIEASHTVREFGDIKKYLYSDLQIITQFFETRLIAGKDSLYNEWNNTLLSSIDKNLKATLIQNFVSEINKRYEKYGESPKVLEPNLKMSAGGLRDIQSIEWMFMLSNQTLINSQFEATQIEVFIDHLIKDKISSVSEAKRILESYKLILSLRHILHLTTKSKTDRFEFAAQMKAASVLGYDDRALQDFMKKFFKATTIINRFSKSMIKKFSGEISSRIPDSLSYELDEDFSIKGKIISRSKSEPLTFSDILRACYYRGLHSARFDEKLRSTIIETMENVSNSEFTESVSSVFFREILRLPKNVGETLSVMNELGILDNFMPEFADLNGFVQHGVYHCYSADEHTITTIKNLEKLYNDKSTLGLLFNSLKNHEILFLAMLFHDIAKPIDIPGHEIIGAEMAASIMSRLGYSENEISMVSFLVRNHLVMEQVAFRRNLNDPETLNNFSSRFNSIEELDLLYLVTYGDLSAVNPAVWTSWKAELLFELYRKSKAMIEDKLSGEQIIFSNTYVVPKEISRHSKKISDSDVEEHFESLTDDMSYATHFTDEEIARHIEEIEKGENLSVLFKEYNDFTNITVITRDFPSLLSKLCGALAINDANIHDAKIFTRKDGIVIDTFNVTDFRTQSFIDKNKYSKIEKDFGLAISGFLQLGNEVAKLKSRWRRLESKFFRRSGDIKIDFEKHDRFTIIDVHSSDRLGFLYHVTNKMNELGLIIHFAKIATKGDDIVDAFYVLNRKGKKISVSDQDLIKTELIKTIQEIL